MYLLSALRLLYIISFIPYLHFLLNRSTSIHYNCFSLWCRNAMLIVYVITNSQGIVHIKTKMHFLVYFCINVSSHYLFKMYLNYYYRILFDIRSVYQRTNSVWLDLCLKYTYTDYNFCAHRNLFCKIQHN